MAAWIYDSIGTFVVILTLIAYFLIQTHRVSAKNICYIWLNIIGPLCIIFSLVFAWNFSAFLMEITWLAISLYSLFRLWLTKDKTTERRR